MVGYSFIHNADLNQGTNLYQTFLTEFLDASYFKSEPRTTLNWVQLIRAIVHELKNDGVNGVENWTHFFPKDLTDEQITNYILDPRGMIKRGVFTKNEIFELRQPHRILLFYFLKRISQLEPENDKIVRKFNNHIAQSIFGIKPLVAKPDEGFAIIDAEEVVEVDLKTGSVLEAIIEEEPFTRKYRTRSPLVGSTMTLIETYNAFRLDNENLGIERYLLPLESKMLPFRKNPRKRIDSIHQAAITIQSPLLCMREGTRTIFLTLKFENTALLDMEMVDFKLSTAAGWVPVPNEKVTLKMVEVGTSQYQFTFEVNAEFPPIAPRICPETDEETDELELIEPCEKEGGVWVHFNETAGSVSIQEIKLSVKAEGLQPMAIRNQEQVLELKDDFKPFGLDAEPQTVFSFAHSELTHPAINKITTTPSWVGKPENIAFYYRAYKKIKEDRFLVAIKSVFKSLDSVTYSEITNDNDVPLFADAISFKPPKYPVDVTVPCGKWDAEQLDPLEHTLYFQFELTPQGFGVSQYPLLMTDYSVQLGVYESRWIKGAVKNPLKVNTPYIPLWSEFKIDYVTDELIWKANAEEQGIRVMSHEPLGYQKYHSEAIELGNNKNGFFAIGIENITETSTGNLYFNGTIGNTRADVGEVTWWYLSDSGWKSFEEYILVDETHELTQAGLFQWTIPNDMVKTNSLMPLNQYWLKATLKKHEPTNHRSCTPAGCSQPSECQYSLITVNGLFANAVSILRDWTELKESSNARYLPAGSELTVADKKVEYTLTNPFNTSGEEFEESELEYWSRVFNRVRNRGRMVEIQDFEDLILRNFRDFVLVKCNPRISGSNRVNIVVVKKQFYGTYPFQNAAKCSIQTLNSIEKFVRENTSPFFQTVIEPKVVNPCYREIGFLICILFKNNALIAENKERLFNDLQRYINPWLFVQNTVPKFGCWFDFGSVMAELQSKDYVEAVLDIKLGFVNGNELNFPDYYEFGPDDILLLSNSNTIVALDSMNEFKRLGVGTMEIEDDFVVGLK